jgi:hypothetical protein
MYGPRMLNQFNLIIKEIQMFILNMNMHKICNIYVYIYAIT